MAKAIAPTAYQRAILSVPEQYNLLLAGGRGGGKGLIASNEVLTDSGWKYVRDVELTDKLVAPDGTYTSILHIIEIEPGPIYRLTFDDASWLETDPGHLWEVHNNDEQGWCLKTTQELFDFKGSARWQIQTTDAVPGKPYAGRDPYAIGRMLGNGTTSEKKIPIAILEADPETRLAALQGLMDTEGTIEDECNRISFCSVSYDLAKGVEYLARSLGGKAKTSALGEVGGYFQTSITPCGKFVPFRLPHKAERVEKGIDCLRQIESITRVADGPARCFSVDHPSQLFVCQDFVVTHNSVCLMMLLLRHIEAFGDLAYALLVRESYEAIKQLEEDFELLCLQAYGKRVKHNKTEHTFYFPAGGKVQFGQLKDQQDYVKYQGKSYTMLIVDEYGEISNPRWITLLMSNIRGPKGMPLRTVFAANPGGAQHGFLHGGFIAVSNPWQPFVRDDGETWVCCPSTWRDNPNINHVDYLRKLRAACGNDEELFKAWDTGDWAIARGAYFAGALEARIHKIPSSIFPISKLSRTWQPFIAMDWGSGAPGVAYICGESPGVPGYPKGSLILCDELASYDPGDQSMNTGLNWSPGKWADALKEKAALWGCPLEGVCDEAYGIEETLLQKFAELGLHFNKPKKERVAGWQMMRNMMVATRDRTGQPGLWVSDRCEYFWKTVPFLQRDVKYPEDLNTKGPDHGADACFVDGTIISAAQGDVEIDTLKPGHQVFTRVGLRPVVKVGSRKSETFDLLLSNGVKLTGTGEHPFWVEANKTWEPLARLQQGTELTTTSGLTSVYVESVHPNKVQVVRNLEVADQPEYYANGVLVHNCRYGILNLGRYAFSTKVVGQY